MFCHLVLCQPAIKATGRINLDKIMADLDQLSGHAMVILKWPFPLVPGRALVKRAKVEKHHYDDIRRVVAYSRVPIMVYDECPDTRVWLTNHYSRLAGLGVRLVGLDHALQYSYRSIRAADAIRKAGMQVVWEPKPLMGRHKENPEDWGYQECSPLKPGWGLENAQRAVDRAELGQRMIASVVDYSEEYIKKWLALGYSVAGNLVVWKKNGYVGL